jgi:hypothetical protein
MNELLARGQLVALAQDMLDGRLSYLEGAVQVLSIRSQLADIPSRDADFDVFLVIQSETDHLPRTDQRSLWSPEALEGIERELASAEEWAASFASQACRNLIDRFGEAGNFR